MPLIAVTGMVETRSPGTHARIRQWLLAMLMVGGLVASANGFAQASPELAMREFASGQVKKGVRSIGFGGDGATWGNYALVWKDAGGALVDYADTRFTNDNDFHFAALGATSPLLWHDLAIYAIALEEGTNDVRFTTRSPGLGPAPVAVTGTGTDRALFSKIALPLGRGFSAGVLLSFEKSDFDATADANPANTIHWQTEWRPSGGFGVSWQPNPRVLVGVRALLNTDYERRTDSAGEKEGTARSQEFRLGISVSPWQGALVDVGGTRLQKQNAIAATKSSHTESNLGFEQALLNRRLTLRLGRDETSLTAGLSTKFRPVDLGLAYVSNMAHARVGDLFGQNSNSLFLTFSVDYLSLATKKP